jgi:hypothetical protein
VTDISRTATFDPAGAPAAIADDLACPRCGHRDSENAYGSIADNKLHLFCDCCAAFITVSLSDEQGGALRRRAGRRGLGVTQDGRREEVAFL